MASTTPTTEVTSTTVFEPNHEYALRYGRAHESIDLRRVQLLERLSTIQIRLAELANEMTNLLDELAFLQGGTLVSRVCPDEGNTM